MAKRKAAKAKRKPSPKRTARARMDDAGNPAMELPGIKCAKCTKGLALPTSVKGYCSACVAATGETRKRRVKLTKPALPAEAVGPIERGEPVIMPEEPRIIPAGDAVRAELARRELARRTLLPFITRRYPQYDAGWVHAEVCRIYEKFVEDVVAGRSPRVLLSFPPRHGKSFIVSENGPAWALGRHPTMRFISCSYSASLAEDFSGKVQDIVRSPDYQALFPDTRIDPRAQAVSDWGTTRGGTFFPAGVGGPATGRGADVLNIDDPIKNREEAESAITRESIWSWYRAVAFTRLMPGAGIIITQTRWNDDDLSGRILKMHEEAKQIEEETGTWPDDYDRWQVVSFPAIAIEDEPFRKAGEPLHPTRYSLSALKKIKRTLGDRDWNALYQQTPTAADGEYFLRDDFRFYQGSAPQHMEIYAAADLAISKKETADHSVIFVVGIDSKDDMYVLDRQRGRWDSMQIIDRLIGTYRQWKPRVFGIEKGQIEMAIGPFLDKRIAEERLYQMYVEPLPPGKRDKELRARPIQGRMRQGKVYWPAGALWTEPTINEMLRFPNTNIDDCVDTMAWLGQMLNEMVFVPRPAAPKRESWRDKIEHSEGRYDPMAA